ncbi:MAG: HAD family phosphatase [Bacillota bacterium]|nr:HAD family phosphatase [Bacillota bacterium]
MINTIVFDMGGVIMDYDPPKFVKDIKELSDEDKEYLVDNIFNHPQWDGQDRGDYDSEGYLEIVKNRIPKRLHPYAEKLIMGWWKPVYSMPGTGDVIRELKKKGYKLYLLSNAATNHSEYWSGLDGSECFDGLLVSAFVKKCKPDPEIYQIFFEKFNLNPKECIFIDNLEENIRAGQALGMDGIVFTNAKALREELVNRGLL